MDLFHLRRDNHKPQTDPLPGALPALSRHHVRDLEIALPGDAKGLGALTKRSGQSPRQAPVQEQAAQRPHSAGEGGDHMTTASRQEGSGPP